MFAFLKRFFNTTTPAPAPTPTTTKPAKGGKGKHQPAPPPPAPPPVPPPPPPPAPPPVIVAPPPAPPPATAPSYAGLVTDRALRPRPPLPIVARGATYTDPVFGTTILRVTDERDGVASGPAYSYWTLFNSDTTRLLCYSQATPGGDVTVYLYDFDPVGFRVSNRRPAFASGTPLHWEGLQWSRTDPDTLYGWVAGGLVYSSYNVRTGRYATLFDAMLDFGGWAGQSLWQPSFSDDAARVCCMRKDRETGEVRGWFVVDVPARRLLLDQADADFDEVQIDGTGRYVVYKTGRAGSVWSVDTGASELLTDGPPDYMPMHSDNGRDYCVAFDNYRGVITGRALSAPHAPTLLWDMATDFRSWPGEMHMSMNASTSRGVCEIDPYQTTYTPADFPCANEIVLVKLDGSGLFRVAHHRGGGPDYRDAPQACISRCGRFVAYATTFEGTLGAGRRDLMIAKAGT
jgi:hypothetical protein